MGCCTSAPKPNTGDEPKQFEELDPEESEHGGMVNPVAIAKLAHQHQQQAAEAYNRNASGGGRRPSVEATNAVSNARAAAEAEHARVMSLEGNSHADRKSKPRYGQGEDSTENSTILNRMSQHKRADFFHASFKTDPLHVLMYLNDYDLARLSQVNRQFHGLVEGLISIRHAKREARPDWTDTNWMQMKLSSRGGGTQWNKLRRKLGKEENVNVKEELADELTPAIFKEKYESKSVPCLVRGCAQDWRAFTSSHSVWTLDTLAARFPNTLFRFNDYHGEEILIKDYLLYARSTDDDSPLGLYDSQLGIEPNDPRAVLLKEYKPPSFFGEDLFGLLPNEDRPPYRWILLGVPRSGTEMHVDPLETSAWVTVLSGRKKWCLFPPGTDDRVLGGVNTLARDETGGKEVAAVVTKANGINSKQSKYPPTACEWFLQYWNTPAVKSVEGAVILTQGPGDTVFVPGGWKHIVINLEETVAITHNYAPKENLDKIRKSVASTEPEFSAKWEAKLRERGL